jgi:hypothetical protein
MKTGKIYWFAQFAPGYILRRGQKVPARVDDTIHMLRDGATCLHINALIDDMYKFGDIVLNFPTEEYNTQEPPHFPLEKLKSNDLILITTRPPLDDDALDKRRIPHSGSNIEKIILNNMRRGFNHCSRHDVILDASVVNTKQDNEKAYRAVSFHINYDAAIAGNGDYEHLVDIPKNAGTSNTTLGYLMYLPHVRLADNSREGPGLLSVFGLNGTATFLFARLLYKNYRGLVRKIVAQKQSRLVIIKFEPQFPKHSLPCSIGSVDIVSHSKVFDNQDSF